MLIPASEQTDDIFLYTVNIYFTYSTTPAAADAAFF